MPSLGNKGQFTVEGIEDAVRTLDALGDAWGKDRVFDGLMVGARLIRDRAKNRVARSNKDHSSDYYKHLQDAIYADVGNRGGPNEPTVIVGVDIKKAPHAHLVEYKHALVRRGVKVGEVKAHPYLRPAVDESKGDVPRIVGEMVKDVIDSVVGGSGSGWGS